MYVCVCVCGYTVAHTRVAGRVVGSEMYLYISTLCAGLLNIFV